ncbi:hypothetical protein ACIP93_33730 [Streptomyces sp. NPDC088745]|uniref:hypothetical protein n=1 Tax=Streptomyces sp. NPDC088745 TaxID=3365884 RepID=UPI00381A05EF
MMKNFTFWRLPAGTFLGFQRHGRDGLISRTFYTGNMPVEVCVSASTWTRDAYYGPGEHRRFGQWQRTLRTMWRGTGRVVASYCPDQPQVWGGLALGLPRLDLSLYWKSRSFLRETARHGWLESCQACTDADRPRWSVMHDLRKSTRRKT